MRGSIRERSPGRFAIILEQHDATTGARKRKWHSFAGTKRQAQIECARLISEMKSGAYLEPAKLSVGQFLERWLEHQKPLLSPRSAERYADLVRKNIVPLLGAVLLTQLQPMQISAAFSRALESGRRDGRGGLSASTVRYMHAVLHKALGQAVLWNMLQRNPAHAVTPPKFERGQMMALDESQIAELLERFRPTRMFVPVLLGAMCGLRRGEIAALRWKSVDLANAKIAVTESAEQTRAGIRMKETKSGKGRAIALPSIVVEELRRHRLRQAEELLRLGVRAGDDTLIVLREDGKGLQPSTLSHRFVELLLASPTLPRIRFHDLRHSHATHLLTSGIHPKVAQERLGHSTIGITLDLYSHVLPGMQEDAAAKVDAGIRAAIERGAKKGLGQQSGSKRWFR
jgi:integrase